MPNRRFPQLRSAAISATVNSDGKIVLVNWLCRLSCKGVSVYRFIQIRYSKPKFAFSSLPPTHAPLITEDGRIIRNGYAFLGYGRSVSSPKSAKFHIADALGNIRVFTINEFNAFVVSANAPILYLGKDEVGNIAWKTPNFYIDNPDAYSLADFGVSGMSLQMLGDVKLDQGYYARANLDDYKHECMAFTFLHPFYLEGILAIPEDMKIPCVEGLFAYNNFGISFPSSVINYGLSIECASLQLNLPNTVLRDAFVRLSHCSVDMPNLVIPYANNAKIQLQNLEGVSSLHIKAMNTVCVSNKIMVDLERSDIKSVLIDMNPLSSLVLYFDTPLDELSIRDISTGEVYSFLLHGYLRYADNAFPLRYSSLQGIRNGARAGIAVIPKSEIQVGIVAGDAYAPCYSIITDDKEMSAAKWERFLK